MKMIFRPPAKTLFLDFDGVLHGINGRAFVHVPALAEAISGHDVHIVITSSWRIHQPMLSMIAELGPLAGRVIDATPVIGSGENRQREIEAWLDQRSIDDYRVLDDDPRLFDKDWPSLIVCDGRSGLNEPAIYLLTMWLKKQ